MSVPQAKRLMASSDINGDGKLDVSEFKAMLKKDFLSKGYDLNRGEWWPECAEVYLTKSQFQAFCDKFKGSSLLEDAMPTLPALSKWLLEKAFNNMDSNKDGNCSVDELTDLISALENIRAMEPKHAETLINAADTNGDGVLSRWEFNRFCIFAMTTMFGEDAKTSEAWHPFVSKNFLTTRERRRYKNKKKKDHAKKKKKARRLSVLSEGSF